MDGYVRRERPPLELLDDEPVGECSDAEVDEEELNSFLMGDLLATPEPRRRRKLSFADKLMRRLMKKNETAKRQTLKTIGTQRKKKKRRTAAHPSKLTPQLEKFMQEAMNHYLNGSFEEAIKILKEVVRRAPGLHDPFHLLGVIYQEEYGDIVTATGYYLLAAHLVQTDLELWRRIGEMSQDIGNVDQAIYCFKKCLKTNEGDINEEVTFALAMCHLEKNDHHNAIKRLYTLFELHPDDALLLNELSKSLMAIGDKETLLAVLCTYYGESKDIETAKLVCQLHNSLKLYTECIEFAESVAETLGVKLVKLPLDILASYVIAALYLDMDVSKELEAIWQTELIDPAMLYAIATALTNRCQETAVRWFRRGYNENDQTTIDLLLAEQAIQMARCIVIVEKDHEMGRRILQHILEREPANSEVIILLADILVQAGEHSEADELLVRLTTTDLNSLKMIQKPIDAEERKRELTDLEATVQDLLDMCFSDENFRIPPCLLAKTCWKQETPEFKAIAEKVNAWINRFLRVVNDCELDTERTYKKLSSTKINRPHTEDSSVTDNIDINKESSKNYSFLRTKKDLGLQSVEDIIGWGNYEHLLVNAASLMAIVRRCREGVQLLEIITNNKKRYKSAVDIAKRKQLLATVEELSYQLSCFGGMFKIALGHARGELAKQGSLNTYGTLLSTGPLAKSACISLSSSAEKDTLLENRSWVTRQLLHNPQNFDLLMLAGHFCTVSGNWPFAIEEYKRALIQRPNDQVTALCLATSYFNSLSSRAVEDSKKYILLGMTFLQYSFQLRRNHTENHPCEAVFIAECEYNMARATHFLNLLHLAVPLYERCIKTIRDAEDKFEGIQNDDAIECPCIICSMSRRNARTYPHSVTGLAGGKYVWEYGRKQILRAAAYNLYLIYTTNKNTVQAANVAAHHIQWN